MPMQSFDLSEFLKRLVKYLMKSVVVAIVAYYPTILGRRRLNMNDVFLLTTAALTFAPN
jgi:hypothetical protein